MSAADIELPAKEDYIKLFPKKDKVPGRQELHSVYVALFGILFSNAAGILPDGEVVSPVSGFFRLMLP